MKISKLQVAAAGFFVSGLGLAFVLEPKSEGTPVPKAAEMPKTPEPQQACDGKKTLAETFGSPNAKPSLLVTCEEKPKIRVIEIKAP